MSNSTRFAAAIHLLAHIAAEKPNAVTSEALAARVNTNPAVVRRLLARLASAGITEGRLGKGGGALLARPAKKITLADVYRAVEGGGLVSRLTVASDADAAPSAISDAFDAAAAAAEKAFLESLDGLTLKGFLKSAKRQAA